MDTALKRILAYIIDIFLVSHVASLISTIEVINPYYAKYEETFNEYQDLLSDYQDEKLTAEEFKEKVVPVNYDLTKYNVVTNGLTVILTIAYFGIYQGLANGQTIGKRFMKLRVVSNNDKKLNPGNFLLRCIILNSIIFRILNMVGVYFLNAVKFNNYSNVIFYIEGFVEIIIFVMVMLRSDGRGLHDIICNTKVVNLTPVASKEPIQETQPKEEKVIEAKEVKKEPAKKKTTTKKPKKTKTKAK